MGAISLISSQHTPVMNERWGHSIIDQVAVFVLGEEERVS
jgi:hypothetical protein